MARNEAPIGAKAVGKPQLPGTYGHRATPRLYRTRSRKPESIGTRKSTTDGASDGPRRGQSKLHEPARGWASEEAAECVQVKVHVSVDVYVNVNVNVWELPAQLVRWQLLAG
jgi:hypothetical protein